MKNFYIVALTLVFFVSNAFGYSCYFRPYSGDIRVADINGRQIYTLFSTHLSLNQSQEFFTIVSSAVDISEEITMFLVRHADIIRSERSDFQQIISLLTSQKINWIGIEQYPYKEATEKFVQLYRQFKETIFYDGMPQEETDDLLYVIFPVEIKLLAEYPNDIVLDETNGIKIISLEDESLHKESKNKHSELSSKIPEETSNITNEQLLAFLEFAYTDDDETPFHLIDSQELKIFFLIHGIEDPEVIEELTNFIDLVNATNVIDQERDIPVTNSILAQEGNGIVLRGAAHQKNVEGGLTQACLDSRKSL